MYIDLLLFHPCITISPCSSSSSSLHASYLLLDICIDSSIVTHVYMYVQNMGEFTQALENLDVATASMDDAMNKQAASMHDDAAATELLQQLADENDMNLKIAAPGAVTTQLTSENEGKDKEEEEDLMARLNQLRAL